MLKCLLTVPIPVSRMWWIKVWLICPSGGWLRITTMNNSSPRLLLETSKQSYLSFAPIPHCLAWPWFCFLLPSLCMYVQLYKIMQRAPRPDLLNFLWCSLAILVSSPDILPGCCLMAEPPTGPQICCGLSNVSAKVLRARYSVKSEACSLGLDGQYNSQVSISEPGFPEAGGMAQGSKAPA